jgi:hypothetical protein
VEELLLGAQCTCGDDLSSFQAARVSAKAADLTLPRQRQLIRTPPCPCSKHNQSNLINHYSNTSQHSNTKPKHQSSCRPWYRAQPTSPSTTHQKRPTRQIHPLLQINSKTHIHPPENQTTIQKSRAYSPNQLSLQNLLPLPRRPHASVSCIAKSRNNKMLLYSPMRLPQTQRKRRRVDSRIHSNRTCRLMRIEPLWRE